MGQRLTGPRTARVLAAVIPPTEYISGWCFFIGMRPRLIGTVLLVLLGVFTTALVIARKRGTSNDCGYSSRPSKVRPGPVIRNVILAVLVVTGAGSTPVDHDIVAQATALVVILILYVYRYTELGLAWKEPVWPSEVELAA